MQRPVPDTWSALSHWSVRDFCFRQPDVDSYGLGLGLGLSVKCLIRNQGASDLITNSKIIVLTAHVWRVFGQMIILDQAATAHVPLIVDGGTSEPQLASVRPALLVNSIQEIPKRVFSLVLLFGKSQLCLQYILSLPLLRGIWSQCSSHLRVCAADPFLCCRVWAMSGTRFYLCAVFCDHHSARPVGGSHH